MKLKFDDRPFIIAGPCSAESREQVMSAAKGVAASGAHLFRAGVWKPRTRPGNFEGHGKPALEWVVDAGKEFGLKTTIEVASTQHVEEALNAGIDALWIGARTTVNPFLVQELAEALKGTNVAVMVKNPVNPDLGLWIGALERLEKNGLTELAAIHRGFSTYDRTPYRNSPNWNIAIELRTSHVDLPIYCDPSHICGNRELLAQVSQKAIDLDMDGLMLEVHPDPDNAWSDAEQQITPSTLLKLLDAITWRTPDIHDVASSSKLEGLRALIDQIDHDIISQLSERMEISRKIGEHKKDNGITIFQPERWGEILSDRFEYGRGKKITHRFVRALMDAIHEESIQQQTTIMNNGKFTEEEE